MEKNDLIELLRAMGRELREEEEPGEEGPKRPEKGYKEPYRGPYWGYLPEELKAKLNRKEGMETEVIEEEKGLELPHIRTEKVEIESEELEDVRNINFFYPLIPKKPKKGEKIYAYANVVWDAKENGLIYYVVEPKISERYKKLVEDLKTDLEERLDVDFTKLRRMEAQAYLEEKIDEALSISGVQIPERESDIVKYYLKRDFIGLERLEPLLRDPNLEEISCDGYNIPIYVHHRNPKFGSMKTNIWFRSKYNLDSYVMKLAQRSGRTISVAEPLVDASLPDGSRLQATLSTDIARRGSNFTIRKFTENPLTPIDLMNYGTVDSRMMAYFWLCVEYNKSFLVSGGTATGKTSFLNALSMFIRPEMKVISIEDTPELRLQHPHWVPEVAREAISEEGRGKVDLYKLLKESLRQRPDYIIIGEVRGREAYVLFQQMSIGHPGFSTIHSENIRKLMNRLTTKPIDLPTSLLENLDVIIFLTKTRYKGKEIRKVREVLEMERYDDKKEKPIVNKLFEWDPKENQLKATGKSFLLKKILEGTNLSKRKVMKEIRDRAKILKWAREKGISDYRSFTRLVSRYYSDPKAVLDMVG